MNAVRAWSAVIGLVAFIVVVPLATAGYLWHVRDTTPHRSQWNDRYLNPTTPLSEEEVAKTRGYGPVTPTP